MSATTTSISEDRIRRAILEGHLASLRHGCECWVHVTVYPSGDVEHAIDTSRRTVAPPHPDPDLRADHSPAIVWAREVMRPPTADELAAIEECSRADWKEWLGINSPSREELNWLLGPTGLTLAD